MARHGQTRNLAGYNSLVTHPKVLARGLLLVVALLALLAVPMAFAPAEGGPAE